MALIDPKLAEILVCPVDHGDLIQDESRSVLECQTCHRGYPVQDGIPIMLVDEGENH